MTIADLNRFTVTCALVSDLYYGGYGGDDVLSKDSKLAEAASRYKVDSAKIATAVKSELAARRRKSRANGSAKKRSNR